MDLKIAGAFLKKYFSNIPQSMLEFKSENFPFLKSGVYLVSDECAVVDDMEFLEKEFGFLKRDCVQTVVDCSPIGGRGDVLIDAGYADQLTIGCDFSSKIMGRTYGNYGCARFMEFAAPKLQELGYQAALQKILVGNPARILAV